MAVEIRRLQITPEEIYALGWQGALKTWGQETKVPPYPIHEPLEVLRNRFYVPPEVSKPNDLTKLQSAWPRAKNLIDVAGRIINDHNHSGWRDIEFSNEFMGTLWDEAGFRNELIAKGRDGLTVNELMFFLEYRRLINNPLVGKWFHVLESKKDGLPFFIFPYPGGDVAMITSSLTAKDSYFRFTVPTSKSIVLDKQA